MTTPTFEAQILDMLMKAFLTLLAGLLTIGTAFLLNWVRNQTTIAKLKADEITDNGLRKLAQDALDDTYETINRVVLYFKQTVVDDLKANIENPPTKEELLEVGKQALEKVMENLKQETIDYLESIHGDVEDWLKVLLESQIQLIRLDGPNPAISLQAYRNLLSSEVEDDSSVGEPDPNEGKGDETPQNV